MKFNFCKNKSEHHSILDELGIEFKPAINYYNSDHHKGTADLELNTGHADLNQRLDVLYQEVIANRILEVGIIPNSRPIINRQLSWRTIYPYQCRVYDTKVVEDIKLFVNSQKESMLERIKAMCSDNIIRYSYTPLLDNIMAESLKTDLDDYCLVVPKVHFITEHYGQIYHDLVFMVKKETYHTINQDKDVLFKNLENELMQIFCFSEYYVLN